MDTLPDEKVFPGADEKTPSRSHYFTWINHTDEGPTEAQSLANLAFFQMLHDRYGMRLEIYAWDEGTIDGRNRYENLEMTRERFPEGFGRCVGIAGKMGTRLGFWAGPDGFGETPQEEKARTEMLIGFCRDFHFFLFKFDAVCGDLRPGKQEAFRNMLIECRKYSPDLIVLDHRLHLGIAAPHVTTTLWEGQETYIDVHLSNPITGTHNRVGALARGLPPHLTRLAEDHGVCLSSCLDFWDDDLILQAFNRNLILAPEIYGNPWLLRDDELPKLARIYNLHRRYNSILVNGVELPAAPYGPHAVSRGDHATRFLTLRNLTWNPVRYQVRLDGSIGLTAPGKVNLREFHPVEQDLGTVDAGGKIEVEVPPFRSFLLMVSTRPMEEIGVSGCAYEVVQDVPGQPVVLKLLGLPGTASTVRLACGERPFASATLDDQPVPELVQGKAIKVHFPGAVLQHPWHRFLGELAPTAVPVDAEALFESTCFASDNNALEYRCLDRSGPTQLPQSRAARDAFFDNRAVINCGAWDRFMFDGNPNTWFKQGGADAILNSKTCLMRIDFGEPLTLDRLVYSQRGNEKAGAAEVSSDLKNWTAVPVGQDHNKVELKISPNRPVRYVRFLPGDWEISEAEGYLGDTKLNSSRWRASNLFWNYSNNPAVAAWTGTFSLSETPPPGSYLCVALEGTHGREGAYAALRVGGQPVGAPGRAPSMPYSPWETSGGKTDHHYTYYIPVSPTLGKKSFDVVVLTLKNGVNAYKPAIWITTYPVPHLAKRLVLEY